MALLLRKTWGYARGRWCLGGDACAGGLRSEPTDHQRDCSTLAIETAFSDLVEALRPFAERGKSLEAYTGQQPDRLVQFGIKAEDCARALAALSQAEKLTR